MMKKINSSLFFILSVLFVNAQQIGMVSHYFYKPMIYNPAFTGSEDGMNIMLINHTQWSGFKGAPQLNIFSADKNFMNKKVGLGLGIISDKKGINNRIGGNLFYSYRININDNLHLSLGMSFGVVNQSLNYSKAVVENTSDATLFSDSQNKITYDGDAGFVFVWKGAEVGAAVPQLFGNKISYADNASYTQVRHYIGSLKYKFFISKDKSISIAPHGLVRFVSNTPLQYDGNINFEWKNKFWIGATYKSDYAIAANAGFCIYKKFSVGYSYDIITGNIGSYSGLSHEIMVNFNFGKTKKPEPSLVNEPEEPIAKESSKVETKTQDFDSLELILEEKHQKENQEALKNKPPDHAMYEKGWDIIETKLKGQDMIIDNRVWIATNKVRDFKDESNQSPQIGYYIVVGSFLNLDLAKNFVQRLITKSYKATNWIYFEPTKFNYVFITRVDTKEEAFKQANNVKVAGYEDVWIQRIIE